MYELKIKTQIVNDRKTGMSYGVIGKKYGIPKSSVQHIVENYGHISKKRGPKEKLAKGDNRRLQIFIKRQHVQNLKFCISDNKKEFKLTVSKSTVSRSLKGMKFQYKINSI